MQDKNDVSKELENDATDSPSLPQSDDIIEPEKDSDPAVESDDAVEDIVRSEGDSVLAAEDEELQKAFEPEHPKNLRTKIKDTFWKWWNNKKIRYSTFAGIFVLILLIAIVPTSRYFVLNTVGVRAKASVVVYDDQTDNPLKNVQVSIGAQSATTDINGKAQLTSVKLGKQDLKIQKRAYAETVKTITVGLGSNPLGNASIKAVGSQYSFNITDWLSGKPIDKVEASSGNFDATSDSEGALTLVVDATADENLEVTMKAVGYRDEQVKVEPSSKQSQDVKLVPKRKQPFISKRSGKYDLYKIDADGKNEKLILPGTGTENESIGLVSHPDSEVVALTSTRNNVRNKQGYILTTLSLIDLEDDSNTNVAQSEQVQIIGWSGDRLLYVQIAAGASASNPKRQRLVSYDYKKSDKVELASSNNFNDVLLVGNKVYYSLSSPQPGFFVQSVDSKNRTTVIDKETWSIYRTSYSQLDISVAQDWYKMQIGESTAKKESNQPSNLTSRIYSDSADGARSLWVDQRDGKGVLVLYDRDSDKEKALVSQAGLENPVRWLNNTTLVYRIHTPQETADYVLNIEGGSAKKIRDVTSTYGVDRWYH